MSKLKCDFSGYATKNDLKCTDGRVIQKDAFKHNDGQRVPLVWQHLHSEPDNILGHAILENREDGVYAYGVFNDSKAGVTAKELVKHGDITNLSIYANSLKQNGTSVLHGVIREVSLVLSGANPGAIIDNLNFAHADGSITEADDEAIIHTGLDFELEAEDKAEEEKKIEHAEDTKSVEEVLNSLTEEQKTLVYYFVGKALDETSGAAEHSNLDEEGDNIMKSNVFDKKEATADQKTLTHSQILTIMSDAAACGSLKEAFLAHAVTYGIENIDLLFPDAQSITNAPDFVKRRTEWVDAILSGSKHTPFSRIKSLSADLTLDTARAKGYVKGTLKKEEFFALSKRVTGPTTIYKKQKLDRDDIIDITDLDVVAWLKAEMRVMLDEEIARAVLIGDGREPDDDDKISETCIRPIAKDDDFYAHRLQVVANTGAATLIEEIIRARKNYKGSGTPAFYTTEDIITDMLLVKDKMGRRLYNTEADVCAAIRVTRLVPVEVMEGYTSDTGNLIGIMVNINDYVIGADKGGQVSMFDDFDIDYNQFKYLIEGRCSGCLVKPKSAVVIWRASGTLVAPTTPTFVQGTNTITIPTKAGVTYLIDDEVVTAGAVVITEDTVVEANANTGYYFAPNTTDSWTFTFVQG